MPYTKRLAVVPSRARSAHLAPGPESGAVTYLGVVLEGRERNHVSVPVDGGDCQVRRLDELKDLWIMINAVIDVLLAKFDQVNDVVTVIWICSSEHDAVIVKLLLVFHNLVSFCHMISQSYASASFTKSAFL